MSKIKITDVNNRHKFITFRVDGLKDGIIVGLTHPELDIEDPEQGISVGYQGESVVVPFKVGLSKFGKQRIERYGSDLDEAIEETGIFKSGSLEDMIADIEKGEVDMKQVEAMKKAFKDIENVEVEIVDGTLK